MTTPHLTAAYTSIKHRLVSLKQLDKLIGVYRDLATLTKSGYMTDQHAATALKSRFEL